MLSSLHYCMIYNNKKCAGLKLVLSTKHSIETLPVLSEIKEASFAMTVERDRKAESKNSSVDFRVDEAVGSWCSKATLPLKALEISGIILFNIT